MTDDDSSLWRTVVEKIVRVVVQNRLGLTFYSFVVIINLNINRFIIMIGGISTPISHR